MRAVLSVLLVSVTAFGLAGCVAQKSATPSAPETAAPTSLPSASATPQPKPPVVIHLDGSATDNVPYFRRVGHGLLDKNPNAKGRTIVDAFVAAGYPKKNMEVTPDKTSIGLDAWNIEWSIRLNGTCIIGQAGNVGFHFFVAPLLATGKCLIGQTRTIDW